MLHLLISLNIKTTKFHVSSSSHPFFYFQSISYFTISTKNKSWFATGHKICLVAHASHPPFLSWACWWIWLPDTPAHPLQILLGSHLHRRGAVKPKSLDINSVWAHLTHISLDKSPFLSDRPWFSPTQGRRVTLNGKSYFLSWERAKETQPRAKWK